jgi:hypothetical protein
MEWSVRCIAEAKQALASSERFLGKGQWRRFAFPFTVPAEDCSVQELRLELKGRFERDLEVSGALWFDDLSIIRLE